jgi:flotillin
MDDVFLFKLIGYAVIGIAALILLIWIISRRRIVPTNVVHIVQRSKTTTSYGAGLKAGNTYYDWPSYLPIIGITVRELPVSNFDLDLSNYEAYDKDRVPFIVDIKAFFRIADTNVAAQKVESYEELLNHLTGIVQGSVRSIMAKSQLETIMSERSIYGEQFTKDVSDELSQWGVEAVKNIELMDIKDAKDSNVIANIMAKKKSEIEKESRVVVAVNHQKAEEVEIESKQIVEIKNADAQRLIGEKQAEMQRDIGIAQEKSRQQVAEEAKVTQEKEMAVKQVTTVKQAEIEKEAAIVTAEQSRKQIEIDAEAKKMAIEKAAEADRYRIENLAHATLVQQTNESKGVEAIGRANAEAEKAIQLASVTAQTELAREVGGNKEYQQYLITIEQIKASRDVGIEQAKNIGHAEIKIIANAGDVGQGLSSAAQILTPKGGTFLAGMVEAFAQSDTGKQIIDKFAKPKE